MFYRSVAAAIGLLTCGVIAPGAGHQQTSPQTTFRAAADVVPVDVAVLDDDRRPVRGLIASDLTVLPFALDDSKAAVVVVTRLQQVRPDLPALPRQPVNGGRMKMLTAAFDRFGKAIDYDATCR